MQLLKSLKPFKSLNLLIHTNYLSLRVLQVTQVKDFQINFPCETIKMISLYNYREILERTMMTTWKRTVNTTDLDLLLKKQALLRKQPGKTCTPRVLNKFLDEVPEAFYFHFVNKDTPEPTESEIEEWKEKWNSLSESEKKRDISNRITACLCLNIMKYSAKDEFSKEWYTKQQENDPTPPMIARYPREGRA